MLIIDSEGKQQKMINTWAIKIYLSRVNSVVARVFFGIAVYIATVYLSRTEEHV